MMIRCDKLNAYHGYYLLPFPARLRASKFVCSQCKSTIQVDRSINTVDAVISLSNDFFHRAFMKEVWIAEHLPMCACTAGAKIYCVLLSSESEFVSEAHLESASFHKLSCCDCRLEGKVSNLTERLSVAFSQPHSCPLVAT